MMEELQRHIRELAIMIEQSVKKIDELKKKIDILQAENNRLKQEFNQSTITKEDQEPQNGGERKYVVVKNNKVQLKQIKEEVSKCIEELEQTIASSKL